MTMLSFRVDADEAAAAQQCAERLGIDRSELLRTALHDYLVRMGSERDARLWEEMPATDAELALAEVADWGPAEDWSDWANE
jgi:hypothetical protein